LKGFDLWQDWVLGTGRPYHQRKMSDYFQKHLFHQDFLEFMTTVIAVNYCDSKYIISALADYESSLLTRKRRKQDVATEENSTDILTLSTILLLSNSIVLTTVEADYEEILRCLRRKRNFLNVDRKKTFLVTRFEGSKMRVVQIAPLAAEILRLCNGKRTMGSIIKEFTKHHASINGIDGYRACMHGITMLIEQEFIQKRVRPYSADARGQI
jgi:hypothetical protein